MTVDVNGQAYRVTVAFGDSAASAPASQAPVSPAPAQQPAAAPHLLPLLLVRVMKSCLRWKVNSSW